MIKNASSFGGIIGASLGLCAILPACGGYEYRNKIPKEQSPRPGCAPFNLPTGGSATGTASVFQFDPILSSGDVTLTPQSSRLDDFRVPVTLLRLTGQGVLKGTYVSVQNGLQCDMGYGAFDPQGQFSYSHADFKFQEAMAYYYGDTYQENLNQLGYLQSKKPVYVVAHCYYKDNAYFQQSISSRGEKIEEVCLGDSVSTPGASYADDASVIIHELQHGATLNNYSPSQSLNQLEYDEAGALNEAVSDLMSLVFTEQRMVPAGHSNMNWDWRVFSRWALGRFDSSGNRSRGAHRCPTYDPGFPKCDRFPRVEGSSLSYVYPDGLGWPYSLEMEGNKTPLKVFRQYPYQEEIHNSSVLMLGALWDVYIALKSTRTDDIPAAGRLMAQLVMESIRQLPPGNTSTNHTPVTFIGFAEKIWDNANRIPALTAEDRLLIQQALTARGLLSTERLEVTWAGKGPGRNHRLNENVNGGVFIQNDPGILKRWLSSMYVDSRRVTQTQASARLAAGSVAALWFDIQNQSAVTAGGVLLTVTSMDPDLVILDSSVNMGYMTLSGLNQTQIMYGKINGSRVVDRLRGDLSIEIPMGTTYFTTNPFFNEKWNTAIWVKVNPQAAPGKVVPLKVVARPTNGPTVVLNFSVTLQSE